MKVEDLQKQLIDLQTKYHALNETVKAKDELLEGFKAKEIQHTEKVSQYQEQIMKLRDMNTDLFLRVSQPIPVVEEKVEEPAQETTISLDDILG